MAEANGQPMNQRQWVLQALEEFEAPLTRFALRLLHGDADKALDCVQHTFLMLCQQNPEMLGTRLAPWLYKVCRNKIVDEARLRNRIATVDQPWEQIMASDTTQVPDRLEQTELEAVLERIVNRLPEGQHEALQLWRDGMSFAEIAAALDKSEGAIRILVHRAIVSMRNHPALANWFDEIGGPSVTQSHNGLSR